MLRSSIDLGTNTCLLLVCAWDEQKHEVARVYSDHARVVRLGQGVDQNKTLHPDAIARTLACLRDYAEIVRAAGADPAKTVAVATSQARDSKNAAEFFALLQRETGFRFQTLSGDEEAHFTFEGALLPGMSARETMVIDIGGGSTELVSGSLGESLDLGSVRFTERFLKSDPVTDPEFWAARATIDEALLGFVAKWPDLSGAKGKALVGVAGTCTTLAAWQLELEKFSREAIDGVELTRGDIHRMVEELKWRSVAERMELKGMEKGRADVLLAGALILWRTMEALQFKTIKISTRGLRYGVLKRGSYPF